jgi:REP element-mobilizing transposase RayT
MAQVEPLLHGQYYHLYNRGNNGEILFREERNYAYFLRLYAQYIEPVAETYAYCLMPNHFHLLVRIKDWQSSKDCQSCPLDDGRSTKASRALANLCGTYTKAFNRVYQRTGSLFEKPFHRVLVDSDRYFTCLVAYIHRNPQEHSFVKDFRRWPHSSYWATLSAKPTRIQRDAVLAWFEGRAGFEMLHKNLIDPSVIEPLVAEDVL